MVSARIKGNFFNSYGTICGTVDKATADYICNYRNFGRATNFGTAASKGWALVKGQSYCTYIQTPPQDLLMYYVIAFQLMHVWSGGFSAGCCINDIGVFYTS